MNLLKSRTAQLTLVSTAALLAGTVSLVRLYLRRKRRAKRSAYPKNVVILHQFPNPTLDKPSLSPFCLKIEAWLRVNDVKYQNELSVLDRSAKGKLPYITLNGMDVADSYFIIEFLARELGMDMDDTLTTTQRAISRAFYCLCEESFRWATGVHKLKYGTAKDLSMPSLLFQLVKMRGLNALNIQGYGLHSQQEVYQIGNEDLKALRDFLGNKKYFFGGDQMTLLDIEAFTYVTGVLFYDRGQFNAFLRTDCPSLVRHFQSIQAKYFPEWNMNHARLE